MTVGFSRPVNSFNLERSRAILMMGPRATCASSSSLAASAVYCSMYNRMVAPEEPVPESRKMMREPSVNTKRRPCFVALLPSMGSVYSKSSAMSNVKGPILLPLGVCAITSFTWSMTLLAASVETFSKSYRLKKLRPYVFQCSKAMSRTVTICPPSGTPLFRSAKMESHARTAKMPSFSRMWSPPVPKDSSPHTLHLSASMRLPKNFQPVGVSKKGRFSALATRSRAILVGIERATPLRPPL
mmetsp:Transcript_5427/g.9377  ORF Transcript_5427/g.9377 Transcript_5427/m.9377 type:complete len:242 (+) Transcript_5427:762-1487(+)